MYHSLRFGQDFLGDLARSMMHVVTGSSGGIALAFSKSLKEADVFSHASDPNVTPRRISQPNGRLPTAYNRLGGGKDETSILPHGGSGAPTGLPVASNDAADSLSGPASVQAPTAQQPVEPAAWDNGNSDSPWDSDGPSLGSTLDW